MDFKISDYLDSFDKTVLRGRCKTCLASVSWNRDRVASHKRGNCSDVTAEERNLFAKRKSSSASRFDPNTSEDSNSRDASFSELTTSSTKEEIDAAIANFIIRCGLAFSIVDSPAFKAMLFALNPIFAANSPTAKVLSGRLLQEQYDKSQKKINEILSDATELTLTSDGWTNVRGDHIVNFVIKAPNQPPFFYKSINTSETAAPQNAPAIADAICEVIEEIGVHKVSAVVTDNAPVMQAAWKIIEERHPSISAYGCAAHGANLLIKEIVQLPENAKTIKESSKMIQFINNHHIAKAKFDLKRKEAGVTRKLSTSVATRWYTEYTSAKSLNNAKVVLKRLVNEDFDILSNINPKNATMKVLNLMKSDDFWIRLDKIVNLLEFPSKVIGKFEADNASLSLVYKYFGDLFKHFENNKVVQDMVKRRWDFLSTECTGISFMLTPKYAAEGFYVDDDKMEIIEHVNKFVSARNPELGNKAEEEMVEFMSQMSQLVGHRKESFFKMDSKSYWNLFGREKFPALYLAAKEVNEMICSSAASERVWSIYRFIHSRLRNRLSNDKVEMLVFAYINCAILDEIDKTDYIANNAALLTERECEIEII
jgi:hypothetical protein